MRAGERAWTPVVADAATRILRQHGVTVARCRPISRASIASRRRLHSLRRLRSAVPAAAHRSATRASGDARRPQRGESSTAGIGRTDFSPTTLRRDSANIMLIRQVDARDASMVLELGEITCPAQHAWLAPRLHWEGALLAYLPESSLIGKGNVHRPCGIDARNRRVAPRTSDDGSRAVDAKIAAMLARRADRAAALSARLAASADCPIALVDRSGGLRQVGRDSAISVTTVSRTDRRVFACAPNTQRCLDFCAASRRRWGRTRRTR